MLMSIMLMSMPMSLFTGMIMIVSSFDAAAPDRGVCSFFPDGLAVAPNHKLPIDNDITCGIASAYAAGFPPGDPLCLTT